MYYNSPPTSNMNVVEYKAVDVYDNSCSSFQRAAGWLTRCRIQIGI